MKNKRWRKTEKGQGKRKPFGRTQLISFVYWIRASNYVGWHQACDSNTALARQHQPPPRTITTINFSKINWFWCKGVCVCICSIYKCNCIIQGRQYMRPIYETPTRLQYPQTCTACLATNHLCRHICFHHLCHWCCVTGACGGWSKVLC